MYLNDTGNILLKNNVFLLKIGAYLKMSCEYAICFYFLQFVL